jgi:Tfp pilus assembly protein PilV
MRSLEASRKPRAGTDLASERGWALLETLVSAVLLVVVALAVMSSMDVASRTSAANKGRTVASSLAEQDQERMRAMTIQQLSNYHTTADPLVGANTYHVDSRSEWVNDTTGNVASCSDTGQASYVRISTTVTSSVVGRDTKPVTMRGIVAPPVGSLGPSQGTLAVKVTDRNGAPVEGLPVALSGTTTLSDNTNALGCAVFGYIPAGAGTSYTVTLNAISWVNQNDDQLSQKNPTVTPGNVTVQPMTYDRAGSALMAFQDSGGQPPTPTPAWVMVNNSGWTPVPGARRVAAPTATSLFPFASSNYSFWAGSCTGANPSLYGGTAPAAAVLPAQQAGPVTLVVPTVNVKVVNASNVGVPGSVSLKATGSGCTDVADRQSTAANGTVGVDVPYGTYKICSSDGTNYKIEAASVSNTAAAGTALQTLKPSTSRTGAGAVCPQPLP